MGFYETPVRRLRLVKGVGFLILAAGLGAIGFLIPFLDAMGVGFYLGFIGLCVLLGLWNLWRMRRTPANVIVTSNPEHLPLPKRIEHYKHLLWVGPPAFLALTAFVVNDLNQLESGAVKEVRIWVPLALLYKHFGYWPTVLCLPTVCLICTVGIWRKLRRAEAKLRGEDGSAHKAATGGGGPG